ncbi:hypothetical protein [Beijerinckia sp. L45]|uniref:hypothetical protein n=1 Tax=Beijerinckia sp. L45 TaxID=1641855 RepID=UPI001FEE0FCE|nr:hypothetical protein [Beijerinckia sp. L45]
MSTITRMLSAALGLFALAAPIAANAEIALPGDRIFPESLTSKADGTLLIGSLGAGGVLRVKPGTQAAELWIKPGAYETRSIFGVLADERSQTLWVCSNDVSALGVAGPTTVKGSFLKGFDLTTGEGKISLPLPGSPALCNDIALGPDGTLFVTNSLAPQILTLKPGGHTLEVWATDPLFTPPKAGAGLDGIAIGGDGAIYVDTFNKAELFRVAMKDGAAGTVTRLQTSRPLVLADALRIVKDNTLLLIEGAGSLDRVTIDGDKAAIETIKGGLNQPTSVTTIGATAFVTEGQLASAFDPSKGPPQLPFQVRPVALSVP